jgi:hypothetical protein
MQMANKINRPDGKTAKTKTKKNLNEITALEMEILMYMYWQRGGIASGSRIQRPIVFWSQP